MNITKIQIIHILSKVYLGIPIKSAVFLHAFIPRLMFTLDRSQGLVEEMLYLMMLSTQRTTEIMREETYCHTL